MKVALMDTSMAERRAEMRVDKKVVPRVVTMANASVAERVV